MNLTKSVCRCGSLKRAESGRFLHTGLVGGPGLFVLRDGSRAKHTYGFTLAIVQR